MKLLDLCALKSRNIPNKFQLLQDPANLGEP